MNKNIIATIIFTILLISDAHGQQSLLPLDKYIVKNSTTIINLKNKKLIEIYGVKGFRTQELCYSKQEQNIKCSALAKQQLRRILNNKIIYLRYMDPYKKSAIIYNHQYKDIARLMTLTGYVRNNRFLTVKYRAEQISAQKLKLGLYSIPKAKEYNNSLSLEKIQNTKMTYSAANPSTRRSLTPTENMINLNEPELEREDYNDEIQQIYNEDNSNIIDSNIDITSNLYADLLQ